jgi:predicted DNA-binding protein
MRSMDVTPKTLRLPNEMAERLRQVAFDRRVTQTALMLEALERYLSEPKGEKAEPDARASA